ncbi:MAG: amino acid permease [Planctomycetota bacterium]|nr:MAG: amino acid permease [Planctomycetota bacterium]
MDLLSRTGTCMKDSVEVAALAVAHQTLPRVLGLFDAVCIVVGSIIGSGIFLKVSSVDRALAPYGFLAIMGIWLFVGLVTLCGALALAELGAMFPHAGGPYLYLREAYGRLPAFLWGWTEFWVVRTGSVGALACATVLYFHQLIELPPWGQTLLAIAIVVGLSLINLFSTRWGAGVQGAATVAKVSFLAGLIVLPFLLRRIDPANLQPLLSWNDAQPSQLSFWKAIGIAMVAVLWPYDGWINLGPVAEDIREPQRNVPRGLGIGLGIVILVYLGANVSYHLTLTMSHLSQSSTVAADVFQVLFGPIGAQIAALGVMCSTFGATNSNMITGPRIYLAIARDGLVPRWLHRIHPVYQTPANAIVAQAVWTVLLIVLFSVWKPSEPQPTPSTNVARAVNQTISEPHSVQMKRAFDNLTDSVICAGLLFYGLTVSAVYVLRRTRPDVERPYKTWGYPLTPALLLLAYAGAFVSLLVDQPWQTLSVLVLIASGVVYYAVARRIVETRS